MSDPHTPELGGALKAERRKRRLSLREVSYETGVSVNTLSRVERGYLPDLKNYQRITDWLGVPADTFLEAGEPEGPAGTLDIVARHFRADPGLTPEAAEKLTSLVQDMYSRLVSERPRLAAHMRSAQTFTPAAGALLADILSDMQATLENEETRLACAGASRRRQSASPRKCEPSCAWDPTSPWTSRRSRVTSEHSYERQTS